MADSIDQLYIDIESDAKGASSSIESLIGTLNNLKGSTSGISKNINTVTSALGRLKGVKDVSTELDAVVGKLERLDKINFDGKKINVVANSLARLGSVNTSGFDPSKIQQLTSAIVGLSATKGANESVVNLTNALARVTKASKDADNSAKNLKSLTEVVSTFAKEMNSIKPSDNVVSFVNSLAQISARSKGVQSALNGIKNSLNGVGEEAKETAEDLEKATSGGAFQEAGDSSNGVDSFVNNIIGSFDKLKEVTKNSSGVIDTVAKGLSIAFPEAAPVIEGVAKALEGLIAGMKMLAKVAKTAIDTVNKSFDFLKDKVVGIVSTLKNGVSSISSFASKMQNAVQSLNPFRGAIKNIASDLGHMATMMVGFYGIKSLGNGIKSIVQYGSDITEVENIVDVAFGKMSKSAYDFADTAIEQFGLSRVEALRFSGTLMSMFKSSGVAQKDASEMSITLSGLAGDLASFYNTDAATAFQKLSSGIMDSAKSLRVYGVNLTKANLQQYAMSQGITQSYNSMTQAEKVALRYNYILAATSSQQGDFARTSQNYANQIRLLQMNIQSFGGAIGQGIIAAILPAIRALNMLMHYLIAAANTFRNFMYVLTGGKLKGVAKSILGVSEDASDAKDSVGGIGDAGGKAAKGIGKAGKAAKSLKKTLDLMSFDEINKLSDKTPSASGGTGGSGGSGGGAGGGLGGMDFGSDWGDAKKSAEKFANAWAEAIRRAFKNKDWSMLGKVLAWGVNKGIYSAKKKITWDKLGDGITGLTNAISGTLNSFMDNVDWKSLGQLIGNGLDIAVKTVNKLIGKGGINFALIGKAISKALMGVMTSNLDFKELGEAIGNVINKTPKIVKGFVDDFTNSGGWITLGKSLEAAIRGAILTINVEEWGDTLGKIVVGISTTLDTLMKNAETNGTFTGLGARLGKALNNVFDKEPLSHIGTSLGNIVNAIIKTLSSFMAEADFSKIGDDLVTGINNFFDTFDAKSAGETVGKITLGVLDIIKKGIGALKDHQEEIKDTIKSMPWKDILADAIEIKKGTFELKASTVKNVALGIGESISKGINPIDITKAIASAALKFTIGSIKYDLELIPKLSMSLFQFWKKVSGVDLVLYLLAKIRNSFMSVLKDWLGEDNPVFKLIAKITGYEDNISDKDLDKFEANISDFDDELKTRELSGFVGEIKSMKDSLTKRQLDDIQAILTNTKDDVPTKKKKLADYLASITNVNDDVKSGKKSIPGFLAKLFNVDSSSLSGGKKEVSLLGKLTKYATDPNTSLPSAFKNITAKAVSWLVTPNSSLPSANKNITAKAIGWLEEPNSTLPSRTKSLFAQVTEWAKKGWDGGLSKPTMDIFGKLKATKVDTKKVDGTTIDVKARVTKIVGSSTMSKGGGAGHYTMAKGGVFNNGRWEKIQKFASGGLPNYGQMFIARENGPELVSKIGARTAVMNNDQIVASVSAGVYSAVASAITPLVSAMAQNNSTGDIAVYVGGTQVTDVVVKQINQRTKMTGQSPLLI